MDTVSSKLQNPVCNLNACYKLAVNINLISLVVGFRRSAKIVLVFWEDFLNCLKGKIGSALQALFVKFNRLLMIWFMKYACKCEGYEFYSHLSLLNSFRCLLSLIKFI